MSDSSPLRELFDSLPQSGRVEWIGVRPARGEAMVALESVQASPETGLEGDRFRGRAGSPRQVTLIQYEHLQVIAACLHRDSVPPGLLRRNIVVSGINLLALKGRLFRLGGALLEYTGQCHPCSRMEQQLGPGGYNAVRGHGGITARVRQAGQISLTDTIKMGPE